MTKNGMKFYKVHNKLIDIFQGEGWTNWSRYRMVSGSLELHRGLSVSKAVQAIAMSVLSEK